MTAPLTFQRRPLVIALGLALSLAACGGGSDEGDSYTVPEAPKGLGQIDSAAVASETSVAPFVDNAATNVRGDGCHATVDTNAGVRVLSSFLDVWTPASLWVDAGVTAAATNTCPAISPYAGSGMDGTVKNPTVHAANIQYVVDATTQRSAAQAEAAYYDDRRGKGYSVTDGLGPLTEAWRSAAQQTTSITSIPADAATVLYNDSGNNTGVAGSANTSFGTVVNFVNSVGTNASTEPGKRFFKYARPWRWSASVVIAPTLVPAKGTTAATDGGYPSGHTAEGWRNALAMAYVMPERYQELVARALEMGQNRILAGMHSPLDVMGGRVLGQASVVGNFYATTPAARKAAYDQAHSTLMAATGNADLGSFYAYAHSGSKDRFADTASVKATAIQRLTYGFAPIGDTTKPATVPKGAEILLETRLPYLSADQRRVVLKTTALPSGYPALDDAEGYGRLNLVAAADGYGAFNGDVTVTMDASLGGFNALDTWANAISGSGLLTKAGSGTLRLTGSNTFSGGVLLQAGVLEARAAKALGAGDVYASGGTLVVQAPATAAQVGGQLTLRSGATLQLNLAAKGQGSLSAAQAVTLDGAALTVTMDSSFKPAVGDSIVLLSGSRVHGQFATVTLNGVKGSVVYENQQVLLKVTG